MAPAPSCELPEPAEPLCAAGPGQVPELLNAREGSAARGLCCLCLVWIWWLVFWCVVALAMGMAANLQGSWCRGRTAALLSPGSVRQCDSGACPCVPGDAWGHGRSSWVAVGGVDSAVHEGLGSHSVPEPRAGEHGAIGSSGRSSGRWKDQLGVLLFLISKRVQPSLYSSNTLPPPPPKKKPPNNPHNPKKPFSPVGI